MVAAVLVASLLITACPPAGDEGGDDIVTPSAEPGVFVTFVATVADVAAQKLQKGDLTSVSVPKVTYLAGKSEKTFMAVVNETAGYEDAKTYDYADDPLQLGEKAVSSPLYSIDKDADGNIINVFRYALPNPTLIVAAPENSKRIFLRWEVTSVNAAVTDLAKGDIIETPADFHFYTSSTLGKITTAYVTITAVYDFKPEYKAMKDALAGVIDDIAALAENALYEDEKLIGKGSGDMAALQALIDSANALLAGETKTLETVVDGEFCMTEEGDYTDKDGTLLTKDNPDDENSTYSAGGRTYYPQELPLPVTVTISYIDWDFDAIEKKQAEIQNAITNRTYDFAAFVPNSLILPFKTVKNGEGVDQGHHESNYYSVTVVETGWYEIDLYGASGGHVATAADKTALGGKGGHTKATVKLNAGDVLKVFVGGEGKGSGERQGTEIVRVGGNNKYMGGFPNGGNGAEGHNNAGNVTQDGASSAPSSAGGGSTEVQLFGAYNAGVNNKTALGDPAAVYGKSDYSVSGLAARDNRLLLVAGGGGGASQCGGIAYDGFDAGWPGLRGGSAGPISNADSTDSPAVKVENSIRQGWTSGDANHTNKTWIDGATTYTKVYTLEGVNSNGEKKLLYVGLTDKPVGGSTANGIGGNGAWPNSNKWEPSGGGGGGYRGGASSPTANNAIGMIASGSGGSNFIAASVNAVAPKTSGKVNSINPNYGNGSASIKWVSDN